MTLQAWMQACAAHVEEALAARLPGPSGQAPGLAPDRLHEAMRYAVLGGGKRVRPLLVYAAGELVGADARVLDGAACAVELIHVYSLVHDDMPAMDNDDMRRGKPTVHRQYGEAMAMLVGDALQALAFEVLVAPLVEGDPQAARVPAATMVAALARAAGSWGMAGGQALDIEGVGLRLSRPQLEAMHRAKTGAMLSVSVELGLLAGGQPSADLAEAMQRYGRAIGLAFQVVDDILDVTADSATLGKTAGKDQAQDKPTYVSLLGLEGARALAADLHAQAHACLQALGPRADRLRMLADFIVERLH
ncbi:polyprenyl synthetase family protein [Lautropia mirabilis]